MTNSTDQSAKPTTLFAQRPMSARTIWLWTLVVTLVAFVENHPWWPHPGFILIYATLAIVVPLAYRSYRWSWTAEAVRKDWPVIAQAFVVFWLGLILETILYLGVLRAVGAASDPSINYLLATDHIIRTMMATIGGVPTAIIFLIFFGIWPMFGEELLYRGFLFGGLRQWHWFGAATAIAAVPFALRHSVQILPAWSGHLAAFPWRAFLGAAIYPFLGGFVYSWVYERTRNLAIGMALHLINNVLWWLLLVLYFSHR